MNERIEQLAERATKEMDQEAFSEDMNIPAEWYHKFAELIVEDCAGIVDNWGRWLLYDKLAVKVKQHFGVEECNN